MKDATPALLDWWVLPINGNAPVKTGAASMLAGNLSPALDWIDDGTSRVLYSSISGDAANLWQLPLSNSYVAQGPPRPITHGPGRHLRGSAAAGAVAFSDETENINIWQMPIDPKRGMPAGEPRRVTAGKRPAWRRRSPAMAAKWFSFAGPLAAIAY